MSQRTWDNIQRSSDLPGALTNWGKWAQARQPAYVPLSTMFPPLSTRRPPPKINETNLQNTKLISASNFIASPTSGTTEV